MAESLFIGVMLGLATVGLASVIAHVIERYL